ncbi:unnamed protein product [marine sediment metagenome]|uniref:Aldehyde ferredoxin oxidoreductase N-terminal domain-containing protein n=1 Tax=marine sediment metagenome TaxID=412755 RepID=X1C612_9ZZZZ
MLKAFRGQLLYVDLSNHSISVESLDDTIARNFLGGAGYACRYLYDRLNKDTDDLKWEDLISPTMSPDDYLKVYGEKIEFNYKTYEPKLDILEKISTLLKEKKEKLKIVALGADWCPDCNRNVPRMIKNVKQEKMFRQRLALKLYVYLVRLVG